MSSRAISSLKHLQRVAKDLIVLRRFQSVLTELRHRKLARQLLLQMSGPRLSGKLLRADLLLQGHKGVNQSFRPGRTTGNMNIDRDKAIDALKHVVAVAEGPA